MMTRSCSLGDVLSQAMAYCAGSNWFSQKRRDSGIWTNEENKRFEDALATYDRDTADRWEKVAALIPGKTVWQVADHYRDLEEDVSEIEAGRIPCPGYSPLSFTLDWDDDYGYEGLKQPSCCIGGKRSVGRGSDQERKKGIPWTEEEHKLFLLGLKKYGKGDWRNISRNFVITRTPTQVASHAQKYFIRLNSGGKDKRRSSIHDITTANLPDNRPPSPSQPSTVTSCSSSATTPALSSQFSLMADSDQTGEAASGFSSSALRNQLMQQQFGVAPYVMKLQTQNSNNVTPYGSLVCSQDLLF